MSEITLKEFNVAMLQKFPDPDFVVVGKEYLLYTNDPNNYRKESVKVSPGEWNGKPRYFCIDSDVVVYIGSLTEYGTKWFLVEDL